MLYVHGFADYFFQTELADFCADRGLAFYALDLRKSGRARRPGQTAHYVSDLAHYDAELDRALDLIAAEHPGRPVTVVAHSTGGLDRPAVPGPASHRRPGWRPSPAWCSTAPGSTSRASRSCAGRSRRRCGAWPGCGRSAP